jgi:hypothetical protein
VIERPSHHGREHLEGPEPGACADVLLHLVQPANAVGIGLAAEA